MTDTAFTRRETVERETAKRAFLSARGLTKRFGGLTALADFNLEIFPLETVGLIGPNGAGKTTAFNLLTGVYQPTEGACHVGGVDTRGQTPDRIAGLGLARTFQNIRLFKDLTVLDNVKIGFQPRRQQTLLDALLRTARFRAEEREFEEEALALLEKMGIAHLAQTRAGNLAYGQQRRLEIARALASRPKLLLLDEPAAGANESESHALQALLRELQEAHSLALLVIEHHIPFVMGLAKRILVLDHGETIAHGTPEEVRRNPDVIEAYLGPDFAAQDAGRDAP